MSCPYCMRDEGHYLGCRQLDQTSTWRTVGMTLLGVMLMVLVLALVAVVVGE